MYKYRIMSEVSQSSSQEFYAVYSQKQFNHIQETNLNNSKRKEGEEWEDGQGNKWIWKNNTKRKVSKCGQIKIDQRCSICNADMKFEGEKEISRYNDSYDTKLTFKCQECNSCAEAYVPKENPNGN